MHEGDNGTSEAAGLPAEVRDEFLGGRWFTQRGESPGFLGLDGGPDLGPVVPVFSSEEQLARYAGACAYFSTVGEDLLSLLPSGHGIVVDLAGPDPQHLPAGMLDALRPRTAGEGDVHE
ncbi:SseB family protein [Streptomyces sp. HNM0574]|uniref:SseB family protein n=1 Tax=Streptomyces sp. HNM0574 TaxID=2714954 RepID=UPI00146CFB2D|nr:SseB family protein [Streptomyces sp. HNM0574]NLU67999.1 SseB family protein [Streptomyces sp. HNM0574]